MQQTGPLRTRTRSRGPGSRPGPARLSTTSSATASPRLRWAPSAALRRPGPEPSAHRTTYEQEGARCSGPPLATPPGGRLDTSAGELAAGSGAPPGREGVQPQISDEYVASTDYTGRVGGRR